MFSTISTYFCCQHSSLTLFLACCREPELILSALHSCMQHFIDLSQRKIAECKTTVTHSKEAAPKRNKFYSFVFNGEAALRYCQNRQFQFKDLLGRSHLLDIYFFKHNFCPFLDLQTLDSIDSFRQRFLGSSKSTIGNIFEGIHFLSINFSTPWRHQRLVS